MHALHGNQIDDFFQKSITQLDRVSWIGRYAWFGAARHFDTTLGDGIRFINGNGQLSDLARKYVHG